MTANSIAPGALTRMTEDLGIPDEARKSMDPRWIAPIVTWLASAESSDVTGRVIESTGSVVAIAEGWRRGPTAKPPAEPGDVPAVLRPLLEQAKGRVNMQGADRKQ